MIARPAVFMLSQTPELLPDSLFSDAIVEIWNSVVPKFPSITLLGLKMEILGDILKINEKQRMITITSAPVFVTSTYKGLSDRVETRKLMKINAQILYPYDSSVLINFDETSME